MKLEVDKIDKKIEIWNILHDGEITVAEKNKNDLIIFVSIPYLRRRIKPLGDSIVISLKNASLIEFYDFDGKVSDFIEELEIATPEILSTQSESMPVEIETTTGRIKLDFDEITLSLDTGQIIQYEEIKRVCAEYWDDWEKRT